MILIYKHIDKFRRRGKVRRLCDQRPMIRILSYCKKYKVKE